MEEKITNWLITIKEHKLSSFLELISEKRNDIRKMIMTKHYHSENGYSYNFSLMFFKEKTFKELREEFKGLGTFIVPLTSEFETYVNFEILK